MACLVVGGAIVSPPASAEDHDALIKRGVELRRRGQDREALVEFQRALAIRETPRVVAQIGLAEYALGIWAPAEEHLSKSLKSTGDPWIAKNTGALREALTAVSGHVGTIEIWGGPPSAEVTLDGRVIGTLQSAISVRVAAGSCAVRVHASGYQDVTRSVEARAGGLVRENVQLVPTPATPRASAAVATRPPPPPPPAASTTTSTVTAGAMPATSAPGAQLRAEASPPATSESLTGKWWFWTAIGAVLVGGAVTALALSRSSGSLDCPKGYDKCFP